MALATRKANASRKWSVTQKREFAAITRRARALSQKLKPDDFDREGNPVDGPWAKMLADLDAWAKKHKVEFKTTERDQKDLIPDSGPAPIIRCPPMTTYTEKLTFPPGSGMRDISIKYTCYLRRQTLFGRCVFECTYEFL